MSFDLIRDLTKPKHINSMINLVEEQIKLYVESIRPPVEIRKSVDIAYSYEKSVLELFETRPAWDNEDEITHSSFAKAKFVKSRSVWKIYWMRASGKWHAYTPTPEVKSIIYFFKILERDEHGCFFG